MKKIILASLCMIGILGCKTTHEIEYVETFSSPSNGQSSVSIKIENTHELYNVLRLEIKRMHCCNKIYIPNARAYKIYKTAMNECEYDCLSDFASDWSSKIPKPTQQHLEFIENFNRTVSNGKLDFVGLIIDNEYMVKFAYEDGRSIMTRNRNGIYEYVQK